MIAEVHVTKKNSKTLNKMLSLLRQKMLAEVSFEIIAILTVAARACSMRMPHGMGRGWHSFD